MIINVTVADPASVMPPGRCYLQDLSATLPNRGRASKTGEDIRDHPHMWMISEDMPTPKRQIREALSG